MDTVDMARRTGVIKAAYNRSFTELCLQVTEDAAAGLPRNLTKIYITWAEARGVTHKNDRSLDVQISKMKPFYDFGLKFKGAGVQFVNNWYRNRVPKVAFNMLATELRMRISRGYI